MDSGCIPKLTCMFHILPGNSFPLHWTFGAGTGQCCDHNYLHLSMVSYERASAPETPKTHQYYSDKTLLARSCTQFPDGAGLRGITFSSRLGSAGHYILLRRRRTALKQLAMMFSWGPTSTWAVMEKTLACTQLLCKRHIRAAEAPARCDTAATALLLGLLEAARCSQQSLTRQRKVSTGLEKQKRL